MVVDRGRERHENRADADDRELGDRHARRRARRRDRPIDRPRDMSSMNSSTRASTPAAAYAARASASPRARLGARPRAAARRAARASASGSVSFKIRAPWLPPIDEQRGGARRARAPSRSRGGSAGVERAAHGIADDLGARAMPGSCPETPSKIRAASGASSRFVVPGDGVLLVQHQRPAREPRRDAARPGDESAHAEHGRGPTAAQRARALAARPRRFGTARCSQAASAAAAHARDRDPLDLDAVLRHDRASRPRCVPSQTTSRCARCELCATASPGKTCPPVPPAMIMIGPRAHRT